MDLHQRKGGRIALPSADLNIRSCIPSFCPPGKQSCSMPNKQIQDALIPIQHSSCTPQTFPFDQGPPPPPMIPHDSINQHQDIEYITLPVYKTRKNEPQQHFNQSDLSVLDGRFHQENNATTLDLRTIQNISYPTMPEPHPPYFCVAQSGIRPRNPHHQEAQKFMAFQPPPRSPRREPTARALVSQHNSHYSYAEKEFEGKVEDSMYYPKNFMVNIPGRRPSSEVQLPIPFQWMEVNANQNKPKINQNMKPIPEKIESNSHLSFRRCQDYEMFPDRPLQIPVENDDRNPFKSRHVQQDNYLYPSNKKFISDHSFNKLSSTPIKSSYKISKKKCFHKYDSKPDSRTGFPGDHMKKFSASRSDNTREGPHTDNYLSPLNFSTTSNSSLDSLSHSSTHRSRNLKNMKCTCSEDSDSRFSTKKSRMSKSSPKSMYSVGNQTDFLKSPIEEKFLFRETILFGCDEIGKWARKLPMVSEIAGMGDYIREKTTQSRAQNICSALGLEVEDQVIVSGYLKVFLKVADSWLEARNCFGLTENCMRKACQLNSPEISQNYLEWQHASRRLLGNIIHGVGTVLAPKEPNSVSNGPEVTNYVNQNVLFNFGACENANANKVDCRLTRSASSLQKYYNNKFASTPNKRPFLQRQKWTISDTASTTSQCSSGVRAPTQVTDLNVATNQQRNYQNQTPAAEHPTTFPSEPHPILLSELPQHKITPLSQIEPPSLRKQDNPCLTIDISAWFAGKNGDGVNRCLSSLTKEGALNMSRFSMAPQTIKPLPKPMNVYQKPMNIQKSQSVTVVYAANEGSQDSSDDIQQKIYMKPGSYNVPKKKLTNAKKRNNVQKAKESCCGDTEIPSGYIIPFVNAGPFVPPPSRGLQNPNIKIVKNIAAQSENLINLGFKSEENLKIISKAENPDEEKSQGSCDGKDFDARSIQKKEGHGQMKCLESNKQNKIPTKAMKTDEWILSTLINSQVTRSQLGKHEAASDEKVDVRNANKSPQITKSVYDKMTSPSCLLPKPNMHQIDGQEKAVDKGQETSLGSQGHEASQSQASSDKSSHGIDENMTNRSQSSIASRSISKTSKGNKSVWHNSKRRRILSQRTFLRIQDIVNNLWNYDMPEYIKQAVKSPLTDYYKIVKYPVFLETITNKVKNGIYETAEQFVHDCRRLIFNSTLYFEKDKIETEKIKKFSEHLDKLMQETFENWECWNHITGDPREVNFFPELKYSNGCGFGKKRSKTPKNGSRKDEKLYEP
ncbi:hypothetical protein RUM43_002318 [Polyplax serrata]|uniref:Bromo domain-containing protein n=1 Tax=Polyplax serrata TaxID=468196 RepID=A0AAN8PZE7_POLSC